MKKYLWVFALLFVTNMTFAQGQDEATPAADGPVMSFETLICDYGEIEENADGKREVSFTNTGTAPLVINNARGSCGCTVPDWPKEPIMPGETSAIKIKYATNRVGPINKTVKITTNEGGEPHVIKVIGKVNKKESEEGVPASSGGLGG